MGAAPPPPGVRGTASASAQGGGPQQELWPKRVGPSPHFSLPPPSDPLRSFGRTVMPSAEVTTRAHSRAGRASPGAVGDCRARGASSAKSQG